MKDEIADYWNWRSSSYHEEFAEYMIEEIKIWEKIFSEILPKNKTLKVAEIGTGPGIVGLSLASMGHDVIGIDLSDEMICKASRNAEKLGIQAKFKQGDAENLDLENDTYDLIISKYLMWTLPNPDKFLAEAQRLLTSGGKIVLIDGVWFSENDESKEADRENQFEEAYKDIKPNLPLAKDNTAEKVIKLIQQQGFTDLNWRYLTDYQEEYLLKYDSETVNAMPYIITAMKT
jgi:Methylase involved in ubiquinone/menaquinone biosynthesis